MRHDDTSSNPSWFLEKITAYHDNGNAVSKPLSGGPTGKVTEQCVGTAPTAFLVLDMGVGFERFAREGGDVCWPSPCHRIEAHGGT